MISFVTICFHLLSFVPKDFRRLDTTAMPKSFSFVPKKVPPS